MWLEKFKSGWSYEVDQGIRRVWGDIEIPWIGCKWIRTADNVSKKISSARWSQVMLTLGKQS